MNNVQNVFKNEKILSECMSRMCPIKAGKDTEKSLWPRRPVRPVNTSCVHT